MVTSICRKTCSLISLTAVPSAATVRGVLKSKMLKKSSCSKCSSGCIPQRDMRE